MKAATETQVCTKCRVEKSLSEYSFSKDKNIYRRDCKACHNKYSRTKYHANLEKERARNKAKYRANPEKARAKYKAWRAANLEKKQAYDKAWQKANKGIVNANCAKRRAAKLQATPAWADLREIQDFYEACPPGHHIDHIFPLNSPIMCGLHVRSNLQYLPAKENISKGNNVTLEQQLNG